MEEKIRPAEEKDASRIAEISIFSKRMNYRSIFQNDQVSFGEMQVYPLAKEYIEDPEKLEGIWVYDDGFVKGFIRTDGKEIAELYVDSFFVGQGIGGRLIEFAICQHGCDTLWVLDKNQGAKRFYARHGFKENGEKKLEDGTEEYIVEMKRTSS